MPLSSAQLYLCTDARPGQRDFHDFIDAAYSGGVDIIQLREKTIEAAEELELLSTLRAVAESHGKLWSVNDRADVAALSGAPVLHLGQRDLPAAAARKLMDDGAMLGLSTHSPEQAAAAARSELIDYFCAGPVWATPTKPGRAAVGLDLLRAAARLDRETLEGGRQPKPWFAIGG
ncbi:thiamine phosphate synthase, partial [Arthrobacter sp. H5]|uniref:thiamine phosphate synthase n=1 Tax=Arthrobacter sp. H5 TaxID=1267973 RepID=UPI00056D60C5